MDSSVTWVRTNRSHRITSRNCCRGVIGVTAERRSPAGVYAVTEYVGSWDMGPAYAVILERLHDKRGLVIVGLPAIEIYRTTRVGQRDALARASIAIPIKG